jgi:uncharacterized protein
VLGSLLDLSDRALAPRSGDARRQAAALTRTAHRPWPPPRGPWLQGQTWRDLLFAHWRVSVETLRPHVPPELPIDTFNGSAWLGITPFEVTGARPHGLPPASRLSRFLETNVRTYATVDGKPGIWFFSLDAASALAALGARLTYRLPYFHARMSARRRGGWNEYRMTRRRSVATLELAYAPSGEAFAAAPGTLEYFLAERYCLYVVGRRRRILSADIHHPPWPLQPADARISRNALTAPLGISLPDAPDTLHYAARQDVVIWPLR